MEHATFRLVAQCLNQQRHRVPQLNVCPDDATSDYLSVNKYKNVLFIVSLNYRTSWSYKIFRLNENKMLGR